MGTIRPARPDELAWIMSISRETACAQVDPAARPGCDLPRLIAWTQRQMQAALAAPGGIALLAEEAGQPAGYIIVGVMPHPLTGIMAGFFLDIWVAPPLRGLGVADALCAAGEAHCRALGLGEVLRTIAAHNTASLSHALRSGCHITQHLLSKPLAPVPPGSP